MIPPWSFSTFIFLSIARWARSSCRLIPDMIQTDKIRYDTTRSESEWMQAGAKIGSPRYAVQEVKRKHRTATSYASWANQQIVDWLHLRTNSGQKYDNWWTLTTDKWIQWRHDLNGLNDLSGLIWVELRHENHKHHLRTHGPHLENACFTNWFELRHENHRHHLQMHVARSSLYRSPI